MSDPAYDGLLAQIQILQQQMTTVLQQISSLQTGTATSALNAGIAAFLTGLPRAQPAQPNDLWINSPDGSAGGPVQVS